MNSVTVQPVCYCRVALNTSWLLQDSWRAAGFALPFVYRRTVVWREVGKIHFPPLGPFLWVHSQAAQLGISRAQQELFHLWNALVSPVLSLLFLSRTASLLLFLAVSWGFTVAVWIGNYSLPIYGVVILDWGTLLERNDGSWVMGSEKLHWPQRSQARDWVSTRSEGDVWFF